MRYEFTISAHRGAFGQDVLTNLSACSIAFGYAQMGGPAQKGINQYSPSLLPPPPLFTRFGN